MKRIVMSKENLCVLYQGSGRVADILADAYCDFRNVHQVVENGFVIDAVILSC